jgi:ABC-type uncharacterized transport system involved in gliding motility auxiliary subunit
VRFLGGAPDQIDEDVEILMLAQPQQLDDATRYAIDQFVMRGGRVLAFVDPFSEVMARGANPAAGPDASAIDALAPLLTSWGVAIEPNKVVGDAVAAQRVNATVNGREAIIQYLPWLGLGQGHLAQDDIVTADLERVTLNSAGAIGQTEGATTTLEPLIVSSPQAMAIDAEAIRFAPNPAQLIADFVPSNEAMTLAARVTGPVTSAFPEGPPEGVEAPAEGHLAKASAPLNLILVADTDLLSDHTWIRQQNLLGREILVPLANNGDLALNALENLRGSQALIGLRGRGLSVRPFEVVEAMAQDAEIRFRAKEQELLAEIATTQDKIEALQQEEQSSGVILTAEQQAEIDDFRAEMIGLRQELRAVQRSLRQDVENLTTRVKLLNIWTVPILVALFAIGLAAVRKVRAARFAHAHGADVTHGT